MQDRVRMEAADGMVANGSYGRERLLAEAFPAVMGKSAYAKALGVSQNFPTKSPRKTGVSFCRNRVTRSRSY